MVKRPKAERGLCIETRCKNKAGNPIDSGPQELRCSQCAIVHSLLPLARRMFPQARPHEIRVWARAEARRIKHPQRRFRSAKSRKLIVGTACSLEIGTYCNGGELHYRCWLRAAVQPVTT